MQTSTHSLLATVALVALAVGLRDEVLPPTRAQEVGTATAVNPRSTGTPPARSPRVLEIGLGLVQNERIATTASGSVQVLLADKTTLNVGPNAELILDEFVYDPRANAGRLAATLAKGALRFVGGNISHSGGATVQTSNATLGIRGGIMGVSVANGETRVVLQYGVLTVSTPFGSIVVRRPGFMVVIGPQGIVGPFRVSQNEMNLLFAATTSQPGQTGGLKGRVVVGPLPPGLALPSPCDPGSINCGPPGSGHTRLDEIVRQGNQTVFDRAITPIRPPDPQPPPDDEPPPDGCTPFCY
ncbi:MAG TPA: FecR domain-containing protein [Microvirga sp.]|jgi:hypothetical protein|nr:FecR domain-containing protein [Microvirga sp.]